jgi:hypothetical protein
MKIYLDVRACHFLEIRSNLPVHISEHFSFSFIFNTKKLNHIVYYDHRNSQLEALS